MASLETNIHQVNADFQAIKTSLINNGVEVAEGTRTADYADKIDEVYEAGQSSMIDESKLLPTTVSGKFISLNDVSEIPHKVKCKVSGVENAEDVTVTVIGKNLFDVSKVKNGTGVTNNGDGTISISQGYYTISTGTLKDAAPDVQVGQYVTFSGESNAYNNGEMLNRVYLSCGVTMHFNKSYLITQEMLDSRMSFYGRRENDGTLTGSYYKNIQLENSLSVTDFEPYDKKTFSPNKDGIVDGIMSNSPSMTIITDNENAILEAEYNKSYGMKSEYDTFWDIYQEYGQRKHYGQFFAGQCWTAAIAKPKYDIRPINGSTHMFRDGLKDIPNGDLVEYLANLNPPIELDFSQCTSFIETFFYAPIKRIGVIDTRSANSFSGTFANMSTTGLETIDLLILRDDGSQTFNTTMFTGGNNLKNITIQGTIGQPNITLKDFKVLTQASILSFLNALSSSTTGLTMQFSKQAVNKAFETNEGANDGEYSDKWLSEIAKKSNWTITLI